MTAYDPCAMCARFSVKDHPEQAAAGNGWCDAWQKFVPWNGQIGVLFIRAKNRGQRERFVAQHLGKQRKTETETA
jgi:hypothetical protein